MASPDITRLLSALGEGHDDAMASLVPFVYDELRALAARHMAAERRHHTLQPTALVHEAFVRLVGSEQRFSSRAHFFGAASEAMRRILVDQARRVRAKKRGGARERVTFADLAVEAAAEPDLDLLQLDAALAAFEVVHGRSAEVVKLRFFVGMSYDEAADLLGVSARTLQRDWDFARAWLQRHIDRQAADDPPRPS
ncbi:MAG: ECF-type sigma factor [Planctomycetota bacterium]